MHIIREGEVVGKKICEDFWVMYNVANPSKIKD
jgi:hypothetical protein